MINVLLIRHADIDIPPTSNDPQLNAAGQARAARLARILANAGVSAIFTSGITRTEQTAAPLAAELGLASQVIPEAAEFVTKLHAGTYGKAVIVVGHSNTVPPLIDALTNTASGVTIGEKEFDNLFIVSVADSNEGLLRLKY